MRKVCLAIAVASASSALLTAMPAAAQTSLNFEDAANYPSFDTVRLDNFYNGGTASNGMSGTNYGVSFSSGATLYCFTTAAASCYNGSRGGLAPTSAQFGLYFDSSQGSSSIYANVAAGFTSAFSLNYSSPFETNKAVNIYSGLNGTGQLLATVNLALTPNGGCPDFSVAFCPLQAAGATFNGTARSVGFGRSQDVVVFDDLTFGSLTPGATGAVPEPASWGMMILGLGAVGYAMRRRQKIAIKVSIAA